MSTSVPSINKSNRTALEALVDTRKQLNAAMNGLKEYANILETNPHAFRATQIAEILRKAASAISVFEHICAEAEEEERLRQ